MSMVLGLLSLPSMMSLIYLPAFIHGWVAVGLASFICLALLCITLAPVQCVDDVTKDNTVDGEDTDIDNKEEMERNIFMDDTLIAWLQTGVVLGNLPKLPKGTTTKKMIKSLRARSTSVK